MSFYFLDIKTLTFTKEFLYKYMKRETPPPPLSTAPGMEQTRGQQGESQDNLCQPGDRELPYPRVFLPWALQVCLSVKSLGPAGATTGVTHPLEQEVSLEMGLA